MTNAPVLGPRALNRALLERQLLLRRAAMASPCVHCSIGCSSVR